MDPVEKIQNGAQLSQVTTSEDGSTTIFAKSGCLVVQCIKATHLSRVALMSYFNTYPGCTRCYAPV